MVVASGCEEKIFLLCYEGTRSPGNLYKINAPMHALPIIPQTSWSNATLSGSCCYRCPIEMAGKENEHRVRGGDRHGQQRPRKVEPCDR